MKKTESQAGLDQIYEKQNLLKTKVLKWKKLHRTMSCRAESLKMRLQDRDTNKINKEIAKN